MKRKGNIYQTICSIENLREAEKLARKGKAKQPGVVAFERNLEVNLLTLQAKLLNKTYSTGPYTEFPIYEPKERMISRLSFVHRVVQHAIMIPLQEIIVPTFTADTYSCIKGRGVHVASRALGAAMEDKENTRYCLKMDVRKFYQSIDKSVLKQLLRRKIKDNDTLWLLDEIIDSYPNGVPIGNLMSQYFGNYYLTPLDHWIKEKLGVRNYFRYMDDIVIPASDKAYLHGLRSAIQQYLRENLKLELKGNYQVFPVHPIHGRAIDFVGYPRYHTHVRLRKPTKKNLVKAVKRGANKQTIASYLGWAKHADTKNLLKKIGL